MTLKKQLLLEKVKIEQQKQQIIEDDVASEEDTLTKSLKLINDKLDFDEVEEILENPNLFKIIVDEIGKKVVGEEDTIKTILLSCFGSLVKNNQIASYNLLVNSEAGAGKDYVAHKTIQLLPKDMWLKRTRISPNVFTYWHNPKFEPDWSWNGKICYLEDISNGVMNSDVFKVMCSSGASTTVLINQTPVEIEIQGKPVFILTSASATPSPELTRRFTIVNLDETINQTEEIMKRQAICDENGISLEYNKNITKALEQLKRINVKIPYASDLTSYLPKKSIIMRTHFQRFLDYIKASCVLHQYQRKTDHEDYYVATGQDYDIAREVLLKLTSNPFMIPLTHNDKKMMAVFDKLTEPISILELVNKITFLSKAQMYVVLNKLSKYGFLEKRTREHDDSRKNCTVYSLSDGIKVSPLSIPTWNEIQEKVSINKND